MRMFWRTWGFGFTDECFDCFLPVVVIHLVIGKRVPCGKTAK